MRHRADVAHIAAALLQHEATRSTMKAQNVVGLGRRLPRRQPSVIAGRPARPRIEAGEFRQIEEDPTIPCAARRNPKGSREPVGRSPATNMADDRVELIRQRDRRPGDGRPAQMLQSAARVGLDGDRQEMVIDRLPDLLGFAASRA